MGDNDGYGFGVADNAVGVVWPGPGGSGENYDGRSAGEDGRSAGEAAASNGAEFTDVYSALFPGFGPNGTSAGDFIFPFAGTLTSATLTVDMGDFQAASFGAVAVFFNGVAQPGLFSFEDGFQNTAVRMFVLSPAAIANANAAGQFVLRVDHTGSADFIAFDYLQLNGQLQGREIPEPASLAIWSMAAVVGAGAWRRRSRSV